MAEEKDYIRILDKARNKRKRKPDRKWILAGVGAAALLAVLIGVGAYVHGRSDEEIHIDVVGAEQEEEVEAAAQDVQVQAEPDPKLLEEARQAVVDSYENLGLVQVEGYLNVRRGADETADVIGTMKENSVCEILGTEGDWYQIRSGEVEGYIKSQYVLTGEEARAAALEYVTERAIVHVDDSLNIRSTPESQDYSNIVGQALPDERYVVTGETTDGWVPIEEGYVSAEFVTVELALDEARKMDLKAQAVQKYDNILISKVQNYLNVRSDPSMNGDSNIIGKMTSNAAGEILETLDGWYKIQSGSITGYVTADPQYVATGQEASDLAMQSATLMAIVNTDRLNVRAEPSLDAKIWTQISKDERYSVLSQLDGWVEIELDTGDSEGGEESADRAYISTRENNVQVRYALNEAIKFSPLEEAQNRMSSLRSKVVNYALQFVGGRYVWGGTNPNTGADCSGFVQYVLRNAAGISLPRTSREQAKTGRAISSGEMQPGDLIFYANKSGTVNHVAMYIGNGQIVHAASRRSGIKISTWNYRTPKTIRRFIE
ncbi:MAG: SH3 domain-containing protein [Clostridiales bacterium]|nr:SH3 domain-containing protein [Clostridiales bacterium]